MVSVRKLWCSIWANVERKAKGQKMAKFDSDNTLKAIEKKENNNNVTKIAKRQYA